MNDANESREVEIATTASGYVWVVGNEAPELFVGFATVHVGRRCRAASRP
jgi:hypothetical protein